MIYHFKLKGGATCQGFSGLNAPQPLTFSNIKNRIMKDKQQILAKKILDSREKNLKFNEETTLAQRNYAILGLKWYEEDEVLAIKEEAKIRGFEILEDRFLYDYNWKYSSKSDRMKKSFIRWVVKMRNKYFTSLDLTPFIIKDFKL